MKKKRPKATAPPTDSPFASLAKLKKQLADDERAQENKKALNVPQKRPATVTNTATPLASTPEEEAHAFHRMMSGVKPIDQTNRRIPVSQSSLERSRAADHARHLLREPSAQEREDAAVREHLRKLVEGPSRFEVQDDGERVEGRRVELSHELLRKLRHGSIPVDAKLDLHGQSAEAAKSALVTFIRDKRAKGERCLLIVHGKGDHSPGGIGVLRGEMAAWLSQGAASEHVAAFCTATHTHGGEGATYVLLRQRGV
jgi:DNA-nicking Smr family endonuclease